MIDSNDASGGQREHLSVEPALEPGTNALVVGGPDSDALEYGLGRLADLDGRVTVVSTDTTPDAIADLADDTSPGYAASVDVVDCRDADLPMVGEATVAALDADPTPSGLCVHSLSTLIERTSLQQVYKLLYIVADRVRSHGTVAFYTWDGETDPKTLRILGRALDYHLFLESEDPSPLRSEPGDG